MFWHRQFCFMRIDFLNRGQRGFFFFNYFNLHFLKKRERERVMFLLQAGLIPSWTTGNVSTFSSWLLSVHPPVVSLAPLTRRHAHTHTCLLSEPCWNTCCYRNRPGYTCLQVRFYAHVSFTRGIHLPSPELGHILIFSWLNCYLLSWWGFSELPGKMRHLCLLGPCLPLLDVPCNLPA